MNICEYVKKKGDKPLKEMAFNEVDNVICASLSYIDFDGILDIGKDKISINQAGEAFFKKYSKKELNKNVMGIQAAIKIFEAIYKTKRFSEMSLYNYVYKCDETKQFSAVFIDIDDDNTYISFEGTDDLISGWKEDFELAYKFPIPAQKDAIAYLNRHINIFSRRRYILGGHSKGGNLALVSGMYANPLIRKKIIKIISNDGPGLKNEQFTSRQYKKIENIYSLIIPNYSVVGLLLRHPDNYRVILANKKGLMAHNTLSWQVNEGSFYDANLSAYSKKFDQAFTTWLDKYNDYEREQFVTELFKIFERANIDSLLDIKENALATILALIKESKGINKESRQMMKELVDFIFDYLKKDASEFFQYKIKRDQ